MRIASLLLPCLLASCAVADLDSTDTSAPADDASSTGDSTSAEPYATKLTITLTGEPAAISNSTSATFTYKTSVSATVECRLDGAAYASCPVPSKTFAGLANGNHTFDLRAHVGTRHASIPTYTFTVDTTAPAILITQRPAGLVNSRTATIQFTTDGAPAACSLDLGAPAACTSPVTYSGLADGAHTFSVSATDAAGNSALATGSWTVDATPPSITSLVYSCDPSGLVDVSWNASDASGIINGRCSYGAQTFDCTGSRWWEGYVSGASTPFTVTYTDAAGNTASRYVYVKSILCS